jgi:2-octaprenyl-6-methoxyphenol hydroxylase
MTSLNTQCVVIGGGPAGLTAAIALASAHVETVLIAAPAPALDHRTTALLDSSVHALTALDVWDQCRADAAPLKAIRIIDDTRRLLRAPEALFAAEEIGLEAFGENIENRLLVPALERRARSLAALTWIEDQAEAVQVADAGATIRTVAGTVITAGLVIGADGRHSLCRDAAGISVERRSYAQTALTFNLRHTREHHHISTEFHTETGPFTLVPLPGRRASLVFVVHPDEARDLIKLSDVLMGEEIERRSHSILGRIDVEPGCGVFPLSVETTARCGAHRIVLVGEAAHTVPPIGAQGLNLGLRDAATIAEIVVSAHREGADVGASKVTELYSQIRRADIISRTVAVDMLNRSLLSEFLPLQAARGLALFLLGRAGPLRRAAMREGVMPFASQPRLMRGLAL